MLLEYFKNGSLGSSMCHQVAMQQIYRQKFGQHTMEQLLVIVFSFILILLEKAVQFEWQDHSDQFKLV